MANREEMRSWNWKDRSRRKEKILKVLCDGSEIFIISNYELHRLQTVMENYGWISVNLNFRPEKIADETNE